ncbi:hypothetical protein MOUN0_I08086 [Monosporozyma unispora]
MQQISENRKLVEINDNCTVTTDNNGKIINTFPYTLKEFNNFLVRTHCEENLEFFIMTRQFLLNDDKKSLRSSNISSISSRNYSNFDLELWDDQIYDIFIKVDSPKECNLPQYIRELFDDCHKRGNPPRQVFIIQAIQHILGLLLDAYSRFVQYIQQIPAEEWERRRIEMEKEQALEQAALELERQQQKLEQLRLSKRGSTISRRSTSHLSHKKSHNNNSNNDNKTQHDDTNTSIFLKSRKLFNKFKKTIQI